MLHHGLTPDIDDEGHNRPDGSDVGEVLFGADTQVHTSLHTSFPKLCEESANLILVRREVVDNAEIGIRLGNIGHKLPEVCIAETCRQRCSCFGCWSLPSRNHPHGKKSDPHREQTTGRSYM